MLGGREAPGRRGCRARRAQDRRGPRADRRRRDLPQRRAPDPRRLDRLEQHAAARGGRTRSGGRRQRGRPRGHARPSGRPRRRLAPPDLRRVCPLPHRRSVPLRGAVRPDDGAPAPRPHGSGPQRGHPRRRLRGSGGGGSVAAGRRSGRPRARPGVPPGLRRHHGRRRRPQHRPAHAGQQRRGHRRGRRRCERDPGRGARGGGAHRCRRRRRAEAAHRAELRRHARRGRPGRRRARARARANRGPGRRLRLRDRGQPGGREPSAHPRPARGHRGPGGHAGGGGDRAGLDRGLRRQRAPAPRQQHGLDPAAAWTSPASSRATGTAGSTWTTSSRLATRSSGSTRRSWRWRAARRSGTSSCSRPPTRRERRAGCRRPPDAHPARTFLPRSRDLAARAGASVRPPLGLGRALGSVPRRGPLPDGARRRGERPRGPRRGRRTPRVPERLPPPRRPLCPAERGRDAHAPVPLSCLDLRPRRPPPAGAGLQDARGFDRAAFGLVPVPSTIWEGLVWVNLAEDPPPLPTSSTRRSLPGFGDAGRLTAYRIDTSRRPDDRVRGRANWKLIVENFMECYHCAPGPPGARAGSCRPSGAGASYQAVRAGHAPSPTTRTSLTVSGRGRGRAFPGLPPGHERHLLRHGRAGRTCSSISSPTTSSSTRWRRSRRTARASPATGSSRRTPSPAPTSTPPTRSRSSIGSTARTGRSASRSRRSVRSRAFAAGGVYVPIERHIRGFNDWVLEQLGLSSAAPHATGT